MDALRDRARAPDRQLAWAAASRSRSASSNPERVDRIVAARAVARLAPRPPAGRLWSRRLRPELGLRPARAAAGRRGDRAPLRPGRPRRLDRRWRRRVPARVSAAARPRGVLRGGCATSTSTSPRARMGSGRGCARCERDVAVRVGPAVIGSCRSRSRGTCARRCRGRSISSSTAGMCRSSRRRARRTRRSGGSCARVERRTALRGSPVPSGAHRPRPHHPPAVEQHDPRAHPTPPLAEADDLAELPPPIPRQPLPTAHEVHPPHQRVPPAHHAAPARAVSPSRRTFSRSRRSALRPPVARRRTAPAAASCRAARPGPPSDADVRGAVGAERDRRVVVVVAEPLAAEALVERLAGAEVERREVPGVGARRRAAGPSCTCRRARWRAESFGTTDGACSSERQTVWQPAVARRGRRARGPGVVVLPPCGGGRARCSRSCSRPPASGRRRSATCRSRSRPSRTRAAGTPSRAVAGAPLVDDARSSGRRCR